MKKVPFLLLLALLCGFSFITLDQTQPRRSTISRTRDDCSESCCSDFRL